MTWGKLPMFTGECHDIAADGLSNLQSTECTVSASRPGSGTRSIFFPMATDAKDATLPASDNLSLTNMGLNAGGIFVVQGLIGVDATPNAGQVAVLHDGTPGSTRKPLRIGDGAGGDRKLRVYDKIGTQVGPASAGSISNTDLTEFCLSADSYSVPGSVFLKLYLDGLEDFAYVAPIAWRDLFDVISVMLFGEHLPAATNRGANMYGRDLTLRYSTNPSDAIHLVPFPRLRGYGGAMFTATKEGNSAAWPSGTTPSPNTWQDVDEAPHDGDTTMIATVLNSAKHLFRWGNGTAGFGNPLPVGCSIESVYQAWVHRASGGGKATNDGLLRLNGSETTSVLRSAPGTSHVGNVAPGNYAAVRPGGGAWARGDFDLRPADNYSEQEFGGITPATPVTVGVNLTTFPGPLVQVYNDVLPLGSGPVTAPEVPRQVIGAKGRVLRPRYDHLGDVRPDSPVRGIQRLREDLERSVRNERELVRA